MRFNTIALATAIAFSGTVAVAQTANNHSTQRMKGNNTAKVVLQPNNGNPNGNADGPTTLSGTGSSSFGGSEPGTSGRN
ncbi:hypothetical protein [Bradyrhizobium retamae]|uniref:Uncharacterized protein n=1 Tax=Bradyrhizobium retamae TaxID=1300035 RepID=A0A0R3MQX4_9BRAD|nr:hypothetical protein [Bradyrhizobium retamae]KRR22600.1 hypothetical protein CQ13_28765 [Bradyrhizobium retamae]